MKKEGLKKYSTWTLWISLIGFFSLVFVFDKSEQYSQVVLYTSVLLFGISGIMDAIHSYKKSEWFYFETVTGKKARIYAVCELVGASLIFILPGIGGLITTFF